MEASTKKYLLYGGLITVAVVGYLIITAKSADAATISISTKKAGEDFDAAIIKAKAYAAKQSGLSQTVLNTSIAILVSQKPAIVNKAVTSGQSMNTLLAPILKQIN